jgi:hypothetical protein
LLQFIERGIAVCAFAVRCPGGGDGVGAVVVPLGRREVATVEAATPAVLDEDGVAFGGVRDGSVVLVCGAHVSSRC